MNDADSPEFSGTELPGDRAFQLGARRLQLAVSELPLRYAPFFGRLSRLWDISEDQVRLELLRAKDPRAWHKSLRGLRTFNVRSGAPSSRSQPRRRLMHLEPGACLPKHTHHGDEHVLVLEGAYSDGSGLEVQAGDAQHMTEGSEHELRIIGAAPCIAAVSERGIAFTGPLLRLLNPFLR